MLRKTLIIVSFLLSFICVNKAFPDIYIYIDSNGVINFANMLISKDYKLYIKEHNKVKKEGISTEKYDGFIKKAQQKYGVEFSLIKAVIKVESGFNPEAVSKRGAKGLMQIMPGNYKNLFLKNPFNPSQNIMAGTRYLQQLLRRYQYKLPLALAAYNAGPRAVDKYKSIPPYKETQNFVRKVMKTYNRYKKS